MRRFLIPTLFALVLCVESVSAQSVGTAPPPRTQLTAPGPQKHQPPGHQQPLNSQISQTAPPPSSLSMNPGTIMGYVYWSSKTVKHSPPQNCGGLAVSVGVGSPSGGSTLGPFNGFTYMNTGDGLGVCAYAIKKVPAEKDLYVKVSVTSAFSPAVIPATSAANNLKAPIKIMGGDCNKLPPVVPTLPVLESSWWTCGEYAYNVNFVLQPSGSVRMLSGMTHPTLLQQQSSSPMMQTQASPGVVPSTSGQLLPAKPGQKTLTNMDVIRMVKGGVPESVIISSIHSAQPNFDLSPAGCHSLQQARVTQNVLRAMGDGSIQACSSVTPIAGAPGAGVGARSGLLVNKHSLPIELASPKQGPKITKPSAGQNTAIIAVLENQRRSAEAEVAQMKLRIHPAGLSAQPSQAMSATVGSNRSGVSSSAEATPGLAATPSHSAANHRYSTLPAPIQNLALTCGHDPTMRIINVSGQSAPATFTQDSKYNFYAISGCSFGDPGGNSKVYIYYQSTFHEEFQVEQWSDNWIKLHLDPNLAGVDDQNNLTLVVQRADGKQASKSGFKFYAARDTIRLDHVPKQYFALNQFRPDNSTTKSWQATYTSGSTAAVLPKLPGLTAEVHWDATPDPDGTLVGGSDIYDFSHLRPNFSLDSAWMEWVDVACTQSDYNKLSSSQNKWGIDWYGASGIQVSWQGQRCDPNPGSCGGAFQPDCFASAPTSNYGMNVWVTGPRGVDPWTGKPVHP